MVMNIHEVKVITLFWVHPNSLSERKPQVRTEVLKIWLGLLHTPQRQWEMDHYNILT